MRNTTSGCRSSWRNRIEFLESNFGKDGEVLKVFAYPFGIYSDYVVEKAKGVSVTRRHLPSTARRRAGTLHLWRSAATLSTAPKDQNFGPAMTFPGRRCPELREQASAGERLAETMVRAEPVSTSRWWTAGLHLSEEW